MCTTATTLLSAPPTSNSRADDRACLTAECGTFVTIKRGVGRSDKMGFCTAFASGVATGQHSRVDETCYIDGTISSRNAGHRGESRLVKLRAQMAI